jgi:hypothetical protein
VSRESLFDQPIKPTGLGIAFELLVESFGIKRLKPSAKFVELRRRQLSYSVFDIFDSIHTEQISISAATTDSPFAGRGVAG